MQLSQSEKKKDLSKLYVLVPLYLTHTRATTLSCHSVYIYFTTPVSGSVTIRLSGPPLQGIKI